MTWIFLKESKIWWRLSKQSYKFKNKQTIIHREPICYRCKNNIPNYHIQSWKDIGVRYGYFFNNQMYCKFCYEIYSKKKNIATILKNREFTPNFYFRKVK